MKLTTCFLLFAVYELLASGMPMPDAPIPDIDLEGAPYERFFATLSDEEVLGPWVKECREDDLSDTLESKVSKSAALDRNILIYHNIEYRISSTEAIVQEMWNPRESFAYEFGEKGLLLDFPQRVRNW